MKKCEESESWIMSSTNNKCISGTQYFPGSLVVAWDTAANIKLLFPRDFILMWEEDDE